MCKWAVYFTPVEREAISDCPNETGSQASEAERGRQKLKVFLQHMPPKTGMSSLFLNRKIPFHAEPAQKNKSPLREKPPRSGLVQHLPVAKSIIAQNKPAANTQKA